MRQYEYTAIDIHGKSCVATCDADSRQDALAFLKSNELRAVKLREVARESLTNFRVSKAAVTRFYAMLASQLDVGVPILTALRLIRDQEHDASAKRLFLALARQVESGDSLSEAMSRYGNNFTEIDLNLIRAGEEGGFLAESISHVSEMRRWNQKLVADVLGAAAYPALLVVISMLLVPGVLIFLVPKLEPIFDSLRNDQGLPWATTMLLGASHIIEKYGLQILLGLVGSILAIAWLAPKNAFVSVRDRVMLRAPIIGIITREFILARFCRVMGTLLQNRIELLMSLDISTRVLGNRCLASSLSSAQASVASGQLLADAMAASREIPADTLAMISVAERSNTLDSVLLKLADQFESRTNRRLSTTVKLIEPILLLIMALVVGFIVLALLLPIFEGQSLG